MSEEESEQLSLGRTPLKQRFDEVWTNFQAEAVSVGLKKPKLSWASKLLYATLSTFTTWLSTPLGLMESIKKDLEDAEREEVRERLLQKIDDELLPSFRTVFVRLVDEFLEEKYAAR